MFDDVEHDGNVDRSDLFEQLTRQRPRPDIEPPRSRELCRLFGDLDTMNLVMSFGFEQEKPVCGADLDESPRRNHLPGVINDPAKLGPEHVLAAHIIGVSAFCVTVEKIRGVIGLGIEAALTSAAQTACRAAEN